MGIGFAGLEVLFAIVGIIIIFTLELRGPDDKWFDSYSNKWLIFNI